MSIWRLKGVLFDLISDPMAVRQFFSGGTGRIVFDTDRGTFSVGHALSNEEATRVVERIRQLVPQLSGLAAESQDPPQRSEEPPSRR